MMVIDVCHVSFSCKMDEAAVNLESLELSVFPGESITKFANEAQRLIKIIKMDALYHTNWYQILSRRCVELRVYISTEVYTTCWTEF